MSLALTLGEDLVGFVVHRADERRPPVFHDDVDWMAAQRLQARVAAVANRFRARVWRTARRIARQERVGVDPVEGRPPDAVVVLGGRQRLDAVANLVDAPTSRTAFVASDFRVPW